MLQHCQHKNPKNESLCEMSWRAICHGIRNSGSHQLTVMIVLDVGSMHSSEWISWLLLVDWISFENLPMFLDIQLLEFWIEREIHSLWSTITDERKLRSTSSVQLDDRERDLSNERSDHWNLTIKQVCRVSLILLHRLSAKFCPTYEDIQLSAEI